MLLGRTVLIFVLFLIISITPVAAVQINNTANETPSAEEIQDNFEKNEKKIEDAMSSMKTDSNELNNVMGRINTSKNTIEDNLNFIKDNWWKFWMWWEVGQKFSQMLSEAVEIENASHDIENTAKKLEEKSKDIETLTYKLQNEDITDKSAQEEAQQMVKQLEMDLNISMKISPATNLKEGDIVQIKSNGKYYRYLQFLKIENNSVSLKGSNNENHKLTLNEFNESNTLKLTSNSSLKSSKIVNQAYEIQWTQIFDRMERAKSMEDNARVMNYTQSIVYDNGGGIAISGAVIMAIGLVMGVLVAGTPFAVASYIIMAAGGGLGVSGLIVMGISQAILANANRLANESNLELMAAWDDLNNLNNYGSYYFNHPPVAENMNLTTKVDKEISATLNVADYDDDVLNYTVINQPQHGTLNLTQNGSFSYTPFTNYTGTDSFTYKANDEFIDSNIANVTIKMNRPPIAWNISLITKRGKMINAPFNATDPDNDKLLFIIINQPRHGTLNLTQNGSFVYTPFADYIGTDSFTYKANDGFLDSNIANVTIRINRLQSYIENQQGMGLFCSLFQ